MVLFFISIGAVALFMLGLSITLIHRGRNIQGDVGDNDEMKKLGLRCTAEEFGDGRKCPSGVDGGCCSHCDIECNT